MVNKQSSNDDVLNPKTAAEKITKKKAKDEQEELSEEDQQLVAELDMIVERLKEPSTEIHQSALGNLANVIRSTTSSMTSVPKPLKFLKSHHATLSELYEQWSDAQNKQALASILSLLGMVYDKENQRSCLKYRLLAGFESDAISEWGHEYVRHLAMEIGLEYSAKLDDDEEQAAENLIPVALETVSFFFKHNAEVDAIDLLEKLNRHELVTDYVTKDTFERVCLYMISCSPLLAPPADMGYLLTARTIYRKFGKPAQCLPLSIRLNRPDLIKEDWESCPTRLEKAQLAFIMARQQVHMPELIEEGDDELMACMNNANLSKNYHNLARDLELLDPKTPEDIYKSHLESRTIEGLDSARHNLASTFVNAFVNAGYCTDKLMTAEAEGKEWVFKNKDMGMLSASASLGMIMLWEVEEGLLQVDKYLYNSDNWIKAGAVLAIGMLTSSVHDETDSAKAMVAEYISDNNPAIVKLAAICALGIAYAGTNREDILEMLLPIISDTAITIDLSSIAALSAGLVCIGTGNGDVSPVILQAMMERMDSELNHKYARFMALGLSLLFLGTQDTYDTIRETLKAVTHPIGQQASVLMQVCAYAGTGNVLEVQKMLHICAEHLGEKEDQLPQAFAVLGVGMIAMGEGIGAEMTLRTFDHLMQYGEPYVRRTVPLAMALVCASNPLVNVLDTLNKFSHDNDKSVASSAVFAMGIVGAGTNNARLAQLLRQLATYYHKDADLLFIVRIAQGLLHMGKGTMTVNPYHHDRSLLSHTALAGLLVPLVAMINSEKLIMTDSHFLLYYLVRAMYPRFLITFNEELENVSASVRVGQAVDAVGQVGRPKTITGFQTHETPVLLAHSERADSTVEPEFWSGLAHHKLHSAQLDTARTSVQGEFTGGRRHAIRNDSLPTQRLAVPARMRVSRGAWDAAGSTQQPGTVAVEGHLYNTNTIEEFKKTDKSELLRSAGAEVLEAVQSGQATKNPERLWPFLLLSFADLKKYHFYHWFAFPAVTADPPDTVSAEPVPISAFAPKPCLAHLLAAFASASQSAFIARYSPHAPEAPWRIGPLSEWDQIYSTADGSISMLGFVDPSSHSTRPGWPLRNLLTWLRHCHPEITSIPVLCFRDTALASSKHEEDDLLKQQCESIVVSVNVTPAASLESECQVSGWERNEKQKLLPRIVNLSSTMDPVRLAESALDLNLQLMRWRLAPSIDLAKIAGTRALLIGAGTLGAYTARALLAWGMRKITFVDSGRVSFSNPPRQPLYEFADTLDGGKPKAEAAASSMRRIFPNVDAQGVQMSIPMPGHAVSPAELERTRATVEQLEQLVKTHDAVFLLTDSRESRWLPTMLGTLHRKIVVCVALGFDSFVAMRHGIYTQDDDFAGTDNGQNMRLGCYFCNDVVAPTDSLSDRTLDQQCTVTRPGLAPIASGTAVELLTTILQHPRGAEAPAPPPSTNGSSDDAGAFGSPVHQIRGYLAGFRQHAIVGQASSMCTACSPTIINAYRQHGFEFLLRAFNNTVEDAPHCSAAESKSYLETLTGLADLHRQTDDMMEAIEWSGSDDDFEAV
ncbi:proteasome regulatory particle base subunit [Coemansia sp. RSA 1086]|nr:proteasome regulatory particle base subunit [Coemansia sp. RSA 1086]